MKLPLHFLQRANSVYETPPAFFATSEFSMKLPPPFLQRFHGHSIPLMIYLQKKQMNSV